MRYAGIDLSARRGFDVAVLDNERRLVDLWRAPTVDLLSIGLAAYDDGLVVGVDAPQAPSLFPLRRPEVRVALPVPPPPGLFMRHRVCDYELVRRGIGLYLLPEPDTPAPAWMELGFATFTRLAADHGLRLPRHTADVDATLLEVYPFAGFVTLLGGRPPRKTTEAGAAIRRAALQETGLQSVSAGRLSHDALDALCAAYTAWAWRQGRGCAVGLAAEGLIVLPVQPRALLDHYAALRGPRAGASSTARPGMSRPSQTSTPASL